MNTKSVWSNERKEIATWLSGYLAMVKKWVDKILDNDDVEVDKNKIIKTFSCIGINIFTFNIFSRN